MIVSDVMLTCRRSKNMVWKKEDIERFFELTQDKTEKDSVTLNSKNIDKFNSFVVKPRSRFNIDGENKLSNHNDIVYFEIDGIESGDTYTRLVFCGYAIGTSRLLRTLMQKDKKEESDK